MKRLAPWLMLATLFLAVTFAGLVCGDLGCRPAILAEAWEGGSGGPAAVILTEIRLPRVLAAALVGAALAISGAALQGLTRNPLADPGVLGVSAAASLAATLTLYFGLAAKAAWVLPLAAIGGALVATALLLAVAARGVGMATLILIGVGLSSLTGALMALLLNFAPNPFSLSDLISWSLGSVANRALDDLALTAPPMVAGALLLWTQRRGLTMLVLGELAARAHGLSLRRLAVVVVVGAGLATGGAVALAGVVGFVGFVAPHLVRPWVRHDAGRALLPSAMVGAVMLVTADLVIRLLPTVNELRLGVLAALIGAPLFAVIAWQQGRRSHD